jgi:hypothetical protein
MATGSMSGIFGDEGWEETRLFRNVVGISTWSLVHEAEESKKYFWEKKL